MVAYMTPTWCCSRCCSRLNELCWTPRKAGRTVRPFWTQCGRNGSEDVPSKVTDVVAPGVIFDGNNKSFVVTYGPRSSNLS